MISTGSGASSGISRQGGVWASDRAALRKRYDSIGGARVNPFCVILIGLPEFSG
jgi:hypothetical protein